MLTDPSGEIIETAALALQTLKFITAAFNLYNLGNNIFGWGNYSFTFGPNGQPYVGGNVPVNNSTPFSGGIKNVFLSNAPTGGSFWNGFRKGAISAGLNHAAHSIIQERRPNWNKISDQEKIYEILKAIRNGNQQGLEYIDLGEIFRNFPKIQGNLGSSDMLENLSLSGNDIEVYMDVSFYEDTRITSNPTNYKTVYPSGVRNGIWEQIQFGAYRENHVRIAIPRLSIQVESQNFNILSKYINGN